MAFIILLFFVQVKHISSEKWVLKLKGIIRRILSAIRFSATDLMKLTFYKRLGTKSPELKFAVLPPPSLPFLIRTMAINFETSSVKESIVSSYDH